MPAGMEKGVGGAFLSERESDSPFRKILRRNTGENVAYLPAEPAVLLRQTRHAYATAAYSVLSAAEVLANRLLQKFPTAQSKSRLLR